MKLINKLSAASIAAVTYASLAFPAFAQTDITLCGHGGTAGAFCNADTGALSNIIANAVYAIFIIAALIAFMFIIWGGLKWILSGGDKTKVEGARSTIIAAIIGLIITFLSYFIMNLILSLFGLSIADLKLPKII